jgi:hypothetical protein
MRYDCPPALVCWLLESVVPTRYREAMLGDLIEEYNLRAKSASPLAASRWLWSQACRSIPSTVWSSLRNGNWLISMSIAAGVYIVMAMLKLATDLMISKLVAPQQATQVVLAPIVFLSTAAIGGCVAARARRGAMIFLALMVMITVAVSIERKVCTIPVPWWYEFGFLTLGPLAVLITPVLIGVLAPGVAQPGK